MARFKIAMIGCGMIPKKRRKNCAVSNYTNKSYLGKMGTAIVQGLLQSPKGNSEVVWDITACVRRDLHKSQLLQQFSQHSTFKAVVTASVESLVSHCSSSDLIVLAVKPKDSILILENEDFQTVIFGKILVSIMFGMPEETIRQHLNLPVADTYVLSALPNIAASVGRSATITVPDSALMDSWPTEVCTLCNTFLGSFGIIEPVPEVNLKPTAVLSGTAPAFVCEFIAGLFDGAQSLGLDNETIQTILLQSFRGTMDLISAGHKVDDIIAQVTTEGGVTEAGLKVLQEGSVRKAAEKAILQSIQRMEQE